MGQLSCVVMLGFVSLHIAVILAAIAFGTPEWTVGKPSHNNGTDVTSQHRNKRNRSSEEMTKGLWEFCRGTKNCTVLDTDKQPGWFEAVQGLQSGGVALGIMALIITYSMFLCGSCRHSARGAYSNTALQFLASSCLLAAVVVFGKKAQDSDTSGDFPDGYDLDLGWSFWVDIPACALMWLSAFMTLRTARFFATRRSGYESI